MSRQRFTHLHVHSDYSLLDGGNSIGGLLKRCKELEMDSIALTDHGNVFGVVEFYRQAWAAGIKPILGMEAYIAPGSRTSRDTKGIKEASHHLLILVQSHEGYLNLLKLASIGYTEGFYYRPRIDREVLEAHHKGLILTSACMSGEISRALSAGKRDQARETAEYYQKLMGENFYIEIQNHIPEQNALNEPLVELANQIGAPIVATNDVHFPDNDNYYAHQVLCCISTGKTIDDPSRMIYPEGLYLKSPEEMRDLFPQWPEACDNTLRIAQSCEVELNFKRRHAPVYRPPADKTAEGYLQELCEAGVKDRYGEMTEAIQKRLDHELGVIQRKGFASYFLIVWDFMRFAREREIPCAARGSGVGSLVGYALGISNVDPLKYGLLFERFMDPERNDMPDIDVDICQNGRAEVIEYVRQKYGHVAQIITFGTMKARAVIRDVCRVLKIPLVEADRLAKLIPETLGITLAEAEKQEPKIREWCERDGKIAEAMEVSKRLEGLVRHASVHAAGVVIADQPLENFLALYKAPDSDELITQFDGPTVEKVGLLKMDFLGLRTLSTIERARQLVRQLKDEDIDPQKIDLTDKRVLELFAQGRTKGIFQFESPGMRDLLQKIRPDRFEDLIAANALYRPGPMMLINDYVARKHGQEWSLPHPIMDKILKETYGIMVYQEQVMQILNQLGQIPLARAYRLIKAISKKNYKTIKAERENFIEGCSANKVDRAQAEETFALIERFGGYGFNKSHSTQYAMLAFQTAYFKAIYPTEFMAALLTFEMGSSDKVAEYIGECKQMGIPVLPPDINESFADFTVILEQGEGDRKGRETIRFGLAAVKGVGTKAVEGIIRAREQEGPFENLFHLCQSMDTRVANKSVLEALIKAGALDHMGGHRCQLMAALEGALANANALQRDRQQGQMSFFATFEDDAQVKEDSRKLPEIPPWPEAQMLQMEKEVLGMYVTSHPLAEYAEQIYYYSTAHSHTLAEHSAESEVVLGGLISRIRYMVTKNGRGAGSRMAKCTLEDLNGSVDMVVFPEVLKKYEDLIQAEKMIFIRGTLDMRREEPCIRVGTVYDMAKGAEELTCAVSIDLDETVPNEEQLQGLAHLCRTHPGRCPVYISVITPEKMYVVIQIEQAVRPDPEFCRKLEALLGHSRFRLLNGRESAASSVRPKAGVG